MTAFHFGTRERRLFGYYEPGQVNSGKVRAVLLCHPMDNEQVFAYRTMRQLAARLVRTGSHVLRFDYYGTGDSYGDTGEGDLSSWCEDIETAIEELKAISGAAKVSLAGLRLGANLSARVAAQQPKEIDKLVLWEPLAADEMTVAGCPAHQADRSDQSVGSNIAQGFARGSLHGKAALLPQSTLVFLTAPPPSSNEFGSLAVEHMAEAPAWIEDSLNTGSIPAGSLDRIVDWLK
jgi:uncharacterized protein